LALDWHFRNFRLFSFSYFLITFFPLLPSINSTIVDSTFVFLILSSTISYKDNLGAIPPPFTTGPLFTHAFTDRPATQAHCMLPFLAISSLFTMFSNYSW
jgi:hypothetical protein